MADSDSTVFTIELYSFGFKYGEEKGQLVFDARFLPNPYYISSLKPLSGKDRACADYVMSFPSAQKTLQLLKELIQAQAEGFQEHGHTHIKVCVGCTGGRHRSVTLIEALGDAITKETEKTGFCSTIVHRDIDRYHV